jgi:hypothetical protein
MFGRLLVVIFAHGNTTEVDDVCVGWPWCMVMQHHMHRQQQ